MLIIYYKDKDGKIVGCHGNTGEKTLDELKELRYRYNLDSEKTGKTAYVEEVEDDSLTAYLFNKADARKKYDKERFRDAADLLESALDAVKELEWEYTEDR